MHKISPTFTSIIRRVQDGSQEAAWDLIEEFSPEILRVVRRKLPTKLRRKFDSQDFVQAAWASVFAHRSRLVRFTKSEEFVAFMATVAGNKVGMEIRKRITGKKYNVDREKPLEDKNGGPTDRTASPQPTPSQIAVAREQWFRMTATQPTHYRQIIQLRYSGVTYREIAERLGFDESTVRRAVRRILRDSGIDES